MEAAIDGMRDFNLQVQEQCLKEIGRSEEKKKKDT